MDSDGRMACFDAGIAAPHSDEEERLFRAVVPHLRRLQVAEVRLKNARREHREARRAHADALAEWMAVVCRRLDEEEEE